MDPIELKVLGGSMWIRYRRDHPIELGVRDTAGGEVWITLRDNDVARLLSGLVLARRSAWGYG